MTESNWAERERAYFEGATDRVCYDLGATHAAYKWAYKYGYNWTEEQKALYRDGYAGNPFTGST